MRGETKADRLVKRIAVVRIGALVALLLTLAGCGTKSNPDDAIAGKTLTIYSSVPMHGRSVHPSDSALRPSG